MDIKLLVNISSRAWSLTILRLMYQGVPGRQAALLNASGASRTSFANSLAHLVELGLVERNPGHGHPLRPEFRLTEMGAAYGALAKTIRDVFPGGDVPPLLRRSWSLPILAVNQSPRRFGDFKAALPAITDRALSQSLQSLARQRWIERRVDPGVLPLRPVYAAINEGGAISAAIGRSLPDLGADRA